MPNSNDFNHFDYNPTDINIQRSIFNMDHSVKFSCNVGDVVPFDCFECLPGDTWSVDTTKVVRLQPLVTPIFDEIIQDVYYFFVPMRLVWNKAKEFFGENNSSPWAPSVTYTIPHTIKPSGGWNVGTIADYMGIPPLVDSGVEIVSSLPFRAYALICDQWFRSESVMNPVNVSVDSLQTQGSNGGDQVTDIQKGGKPFVACKFFDYFTSGLPSPQRGDPSKVFPINSYAEVISINPSKFEELGISNRYDFGKANPGEIHSPLVFTTSGTSTMKYPTNNKIFSAGTNGRIYNNTSSEDIGTTGELLYPANLFANLNNASFNINDLRTAFAVQRYLEKSARYGGRYIEFIKGFFGIDSPDARLQRTEYLGGSRLSLNINQVTQNSATESGLTPLGNVAGMSVTADQNSDFTYSCTEHGYIIGCSVLRYHHSYQQGIHRMWLRDNFEEFYLPTFAFLGEGPIYEEEIYAPAVTVSTDRKSKVFAYQERWAEYRFLPNRVAGEFRSVASNSLDVWHLGDYYTQTPTLSPEWIREDKSMLDRALAVTSEVANQCLCDFYLQCKVARALPLYSIPGMIDHY